MKSSRSVMLITMAVVLFAMAFSEVTACTENKECRYREICFNGECRDGCKLRAAGLWKKPCGPNAACTPWEPNTAICKCQPFHVGDPDVGCTENRDAYMEQMEKNRAAAAERMRQFLEKKRNI